MWIKYWTVGNGGMSGAVSIAELRDGADNDEIENFIEAEAGPMPSGYRGSQYKKLKMSEIPPTMLYEEIESRKNAVKRARTKAIIIPDLKTAIKESKERLENIKTWTLRKLLKQKEDHCYEHENCITEMLAVKGKHGYWSKPYITMYLRGKVVEVGYSHTHKKTFKVSAKVVDVVNWVKEKQNEV